MRSPSLRTRVAAAALVVSTLTAALLVLVVVVLLAQSNNAAIQSRLQARTEAAAATVRVRHHRVTVLEQHSPLLDQNVWVFGTHGTLLEGRSLPRTSYSSLVRQLGAATHRTQTTVEDVTYMALPVRRDDAQVATVVAAEDHDPYERAERNYIWLSVGLAVATVVLATSAAWIAAARSLRQVRSMSGLADEWRERDLAARFDPGPGGDEIAQLGRTLDQMLDRIVDALAAERRLTDEIAHELRTPLSVVMAEADLARHGAVGAQREALDSIHHAALRMRDSIDSMLAFARSHAGRDDRATVGDVLAALDLAPSSYDDVVLAAPVSPVTAAVRPLLDNAVRHGSGVPRVEVSRDGGTVVIAVVDDGPGVDQSHVETVFEPGHTTHADGSGLGLPLARRMARAAGGDLVARPGPGGRFEVHVPAR